MQEVERPKGGSAVQHIRHMMALTSQNEAGVYVCQLAQSMGKQPRKWSQSRTPPAFHTFNFDVLFCARIKLRIRRRSGDACERKQTNTAVKTCCNNLLYQANSSLRSRFGELAPKPWTLTLWSTHRLKKKNEQP